jgi:hypothetical protein
MIFPYLLKSQQENLSKYTADVAKRKIETGASSVAGCKQALEQANRSYAFYTIATKSVWGKIKSFILFTTPFNYRIRCAKDIDTAFSLLKQVDKNIKEKTKTAVIASKPPFKINNGNNHIATQPTMYGNPIHTSHKINPTSMVKPTITTRPTLH